MKRATWIFLFLAGCGGGGDDGGGSSGGSPPAPPTNPPSGAHVYYLNFEGQALTAGSDDPVANTSQLVSMVGGATLPAYLAGDPQRATKIQAIVSEVNAILAPYDIAVVATRPTSGSYDMLVAGGDSGPVGFPPGPGGVALVDCSVALPHHIALMWDSAAGHDAARWIIGSFGIGKGISSSNTSTDCMCFGPACTTLAAACTIGGANTPVSFVANCEAAGVTTMNEHQKFLTKFGAHP